MERIQVGRKSFLKFNNLAQSGVFHFSSTKQGWGKDGKSRFTGDHPEAYQSFREELARSLKIEPAQLIFPRQVHGNKVTVVDGPINKPAIPETDALITNQPGLCVCVQTADCVPILLYDPGQKVVAVVHAGWRGTVSKIVSRTVHHMQRYFDSMSENLLAGIGPSIHLHVYHTGLHWFDHHQPNNYFGS